MPVKSLTTNGFVYSRYWDTWSRVLYYECRGTQDLKQMYDIPNCVAVEVNLTGINSYSSFDWERVKTINIRRHATAYSNHNNKVVTYLPDSALELMKTWLDKPLIERLLHEDFLPYIDWEKERKLSNAGAAFDLIKKD